MAEERSILLCPRIADQPVPLKPEAIKHRCDECKHPIWIMPKNLNLPIEKLCYVCNRAYMEDCKSRGEAVTIEPASVAREKYGTV